MVNKAAFATVNRVCFHPCELKPIADWKYGKCSTAKAVSRSDLTCKDRKFVQAFSLPFGDPNPIVYKSCLGNEEAAMRNRFLKDTPSISYDRPLVLKIVDELIELLRPNMSKPLTIAQFLETKKGKLGVRYRQACKEMLESGYTRGRDSNVTPFIKNEKYFVEGKNPRLVYSRDPKFNVLFACYILPIEHALMKLPQVAKGCNFLERGEKFAKQVYGMGSYISNDFSAFESSQRLQLMIDIQYRIFDALFEDKKWRAILEEKLHKHGHTLHGLRIAFFALMASGDMETGCFNTIYDWVSCRYFEIKNRLGNGNFIVDGDDSIMGIPLGAKPVNTHVEFGFDAKIEPVDGYHGAEFCSSKFIQVDHGKFYQVQDLRKLLKSIPYMINGQFDNSLADYFSSLGYMYGKLYGDIPVYSSIARFLQTASNNKVSAKMLEKTHYGAFNAFQTTTGPGRVDKNLCLVEISLAFEMSFSELSHVTEELDRSYLAFKPPQSIPYKSRDRKLASFDLTYVEDIVISGQAKKRPPMYRSGQVDPNGFVYPPPFK